MNFHELEVCSLGRDKAIVSNFTLRWWIQLTAVYGNDRDVNVEAARVTSSRR